MKNRVLSGFWIFLAVALVSLSGCGNVIDPRLYESIKENPNPIQIYDAASEPYAGKDREDSSDQQYSPMTSGILDDNALDLISDVLRVIEPDAFIKGWQGPELIDEPPVAIYGLITEGSSRPEYVVLRAEPKGEGPHHFMLLTNRILWNNFREAIAGFYAEEDRGTEDHSIDYLVVPARYAPVLGSDMVSEQLCPEEIADLFFESYRILRDFETRSMLQDEADAGKPVEIEDRIYYPIKRSEFYDMESLRSYLALFFTDTLIDNLFDQYPPRIVFEQNVLVGLYTGEYPGDMTIGEIIPESICKDAEGRDFLKVLCRRYTSGGLRLHAFDEYHYFRLQKQSDRWLFDDMYVIGPLDK